jgi:hypothetical protein
MEPGEARRKAVERDGAHLMENDSAWNQVKPVEKQSKEMELS